MGIGAGLGGSFGIGVESTYGTGVAPTRWHEIENCSLKLNKRTVMGGGLAGGQLVGRGRRRRTPTRDAGGSVEMQFLDRGMGLLLREITGSTPTITASTGSAWLHRYPLADTAGRFFSSEMGVPDLGGTARPYKFSGCKILSSTLSMQVDDVMMLEADIDAREAHEAGSLAAPSYTTGLNPFDAGVSAATSVELGGSVASGVVSGGTVTEGVKSFSLTVNRPMANERFYLGGAGLKSEPISNGRALISGTINADFVDKSEFADRFVSDVGVPMKIAVVGDLMAGGASGSAQLVLHLPAVYFDTDGPTLDDEDVVNTDYNFTALFDETNVALTIDYRTLDAVI